MRICSYCHDFLQKNHTEQGGGGRGGAVGAGPVAGRSFSAAELREQQRRELSRPGSVSPVDGDVAIAAAPVDPYLSPGDAGNESYDDLDDGIQEEEDDSGGGIATPGVARRRRRLSDFALPSLSTSIGPSFSISASTTMINPASHQSQSQRGFVRHLHMHFNKQDPAVREELVREMTAVLGNVFTGSALLRWMTSRNSSSDARPICQNLLEKGYIIESAAALADDDSSVFGESKTYRTATAGEMVDIRAAEDYREDDTVVSAYVYSIVTGKVRKITLYTEPEIQFLLLLLVSYILGSGLAEENSPNA